MRLQVLMLPAPGDETPWALILDDVGGPREDHFAEIVRSLNDAVKRLGGKGALVFSEKVEVL